MNPKAADALRALMDGNERFRLGKSEHRRYDPEEIERMSRAPEPAVAVIACSDSRVAPEIVFDQPLGALFVSRVPGNVAADSSRWMVDLAVELLRVPLVLVMGHTDCLAVRQVVEGSARGAWSCLRTGVSEAVLRAQARFPKDLLAQAIRENALKTAEDLRDGSVPLQKAVAAGTTAIATGVYDVRTGTFEIVG